MTITKMIGRTYALLAVTAAGATALTMSVLSGTAGAQAAGRVGPWDAMAAVVAKTGGKAIQATYAAENGKFGYDIVVVKGDKLMEVEVDAATSKVGDIETVTPEMEAKELAADLHKALGHPGKGGAYKGEKGEKPGAGEKDEKDR